MSATTTAAAAAAAAVPPLPPPPPPPDAPCRPANVGILAAEVYFPSTTVSAAALETFDGAARGKYTAGLGQDGLAFCGGREDAVSMALSALSRLLRRTGVKAGEVGRLEVGSESGPDASKSVKSFLMQALLADDPAAAEVLGADAVHGCFGGTQALLNAADWVEGAAWDGRFAVVVASDAALYAPGPARPTSGAGAVALLVGPGAGLALERRLQAVHFLHAHDFFRPAGAAFPVVDGALSIQTYLEALDACYALYKRKFAAAHGGRPFALAADAAAAAFHAPYSRLARRAHARLLYLDRSAGSSAGADVDAADFGPGPHPAPPGGLAKPAAAALEAAAASAFAAQAGAGAAIARRIGNAYCASVWAAVAATVEHRGAALEGQRLLVFSFGSGAAGALLSFVGRAAADEARFGLGAWRARGGLAARLAAAAAAPRAPAEFAAAAAEAAARRAPGAPLPYRPESPALADLAPGAWYLDEIDARGRRRYRQRTGDP
jgi:hydroxymethylglutaryl-CoA synthase